MITPWVINGSVHHSAKLESISRLETNEDHESCAERRPTPMSRPTRSSNCSLKSTLSTAPQPLATSQDESQISFLINRSTAEMAAPDNALQNLLASVKVRLPAEHAILIWLHG